MCAEILEFLQARKPCPANIVAHLSCFLGHYFWNSSISLYAAKIQGKTWTKKRNIESSFMSLLPHLRGNIIHWSIRLKQFSKDSLLSFMVPSHVLAQLVIVPQMQGADAWSPIVLARSVLLCVFVPLFHIFLHLFYAWKLECACKKLWKPSASHLRGEQVGNTLGESNYS